MALYTLYLIHDGQLVSQVKRELSDDAAALAAANGLCRDHVVEVYADVRLVARVMKGDGADRNV